MATLSKGNEEPGSSGLPRLKRNVVMELRNMIKMMNRTIGDNSSFYKLTFELKRVGQRGQAVRWIKQVKRPYYFYIECNCNAPLILYTHSIGCKSISNLSTC
jgi:hypothetical protein